MTDKIIHLLSKECSSFQIEHSKITMETNKSEEHQISKIKLKYFEETNEIWIPIDLYTSKVHENIGLFINKQTVKNRCIQSFSKNQILFFDLLFL